MSNVQNWRWRSGDIIDDFVEIDKRPDLCHYYLSHVFGAFTETQEVAMNPVLPFLMIITWICQGWSSEVPLAVVHGAKARLPVISGAQALGLALLIGVVVQPSEMPKNDEPPLKLFLWSVLYPLFLFTGGALIHYLLM